MPTRTFVGLRGSCRTQLAPEAPSFTHAKGVVGFTETNFSLAGLNARLLGGDVRIEGRGRFAGANREVTLKAQGTATAEGLRSAREAEWLTRVAAKATGSTPYAVTFSMRDGAPEFLLTSTLQGLALQLPAPLVKTADEQMPLRIEKKVLQRETRAGAGIAVQDQLSLELGRIGSAQYVRDISGADARVLRSAFSYLGLARKVTSPDSAVWMPATRRISTSPSPSSRQSSLWPRESR